MFSAAFSKAVVTGMQLRGCTHAKAAHIAGISKRDLDLILSEKKGLTDASLGKIERALGTTGGQLAALAAEPNGGPLTQLMDRFAPFVEEPGPRRKTTRKRPSNVR